jgi:ABC-type molybdate transport system ATPase subunit
MHELENGEILALLRADIKRTGGVLAWSAKSGIHRTTISKVIAGIQPPTKGIIKALGLRIIVVTDDEF